MTQIKYFIDRSIDGVGTISVVAGCYPCGVRSVGTDEDMSAWINGHHLGSHDVYVTGRPVRVSDDYIRMTGDRRPRKPSEEAEARRGSVLDYILKSKAGLTRRDIAVAFADEYDSTAQIGHDLSFLRESGAIEYTGTLYHRPGFKCEASAPAEVTESSYKEALKIIRDNGTAKAARVKAEAEEERRLRAATLARKEAEAEATREYERKRAEEKERARIEREAEAVRGRARRAEAASKAKAKAKAERAESLRVARLEYEAEATRKRFAVRTAKRERVAATRAKKDHGRQEQREAKAKAKDKQLQAKREQAQVRKAAKERERAESKAKRDAEAQVREAKRAAVAQRRADLVSLLEVWPAGLTAAQITDHTGLSRPVVAKDLKVLIADGRIVPVGAPMDRIYALSGNAQLAEPPIKARHGRILAIVAEAGRCTYPHIQSRMDCGSSTLKEDLRRLSASGELAYSGSDAHRIYFRP